MPAFQYETAMSELIDSPSGDDRHPLITTAKFTFADDRPNGNKQAVPFDEFESLSRSLIGMPVKIHFDQFGGKKRNGSARDHKSSAPIGHIINTEIITSDDGSHQIVAEASLWRHEFPEIVTWLKTAWADGEAPGISWELLYKDSSHKDGIEWLKGVIASAATFVEAPAYGPRTALLALASIKNPEQYGDEIAQNLIALAEQFKSAPEKEPKAKGGNRMTEDEIKQLQEALASEKAAAASKQSEIEKLLEDIATKDGEITALQGEVTSLQTAALIDDRVRKYTEVVGPLPAEASEADEVKNLFATFNDAQFDYHLKQLGDLKKSLTPELTPAEAALLKRAEASARKLEVPRLETSNPTTHETLRLGLRALARPNSVE